MRKLAAIVVFIHLLSSAGACSQVVGGKPQSAEDVFLPDGEQVKVVVWIENLQIPWSLTFLSGGRALVTERPGRIRLIRDGVLQQEPYAQIEVAHVGEGGLLGIALHPREPYVYAMHTYKKGDNLYNRVIRFKDKGSHGEFDKVIIDKIPGGKFHDGGRIAFGPDSMLYITTGETFHADLAQDITSLGGKILRVTPEGGIPDDNPFAGSPLYSLGNRNPQGLAWDPDTGKLFESEHGPSGEFGHFANDEINVIVKGGNYGWPRVIGAPRVKPYIDPIIVWKETTPPSGMTFYRGNLLKRFKGDLFVATLRSQTLIRIRLDSSRSKATSIERWFANSYEEGKYGRLRDVVEGPDGALYFLTNNTDGRGTPRQGDDRIYRIIPKQ